MDSARVPDALRLLNRLVSCSHHRSGRSNDGRATKTVRSNLFEMLLGHRHTPWT